MFEGESFLPKSPANRTLLYRNAVARHALRVQNDDLKRQFEQVMAAHGAQKRFLQEELHSLQASSSLTRTSLAPAVALTATMSGPHQHFSSTSTGKFFISPFNRNRSKKDPALSMMLPPPASSAAIAAQLQSPGAVEAPASVLHHLEVHPGRSSRGEMEAVRGFPTAYTVAMTTTRHHVPISTSPSLKLRQTLSNGLKLQPVATSQLTSPLNSTQTHGGGGKAIRVKVQLKVKLPPLKIADPPPNVQGNEVDNAEPVKRRVLRLRAKAAPKSISTDANSRFESLRKIDVMFAGERAVTQRSTTAYVSSIASGVGEKEKENMMELRCSDGTLCQVPISGTQKLQRLVASRDSSREQELPRRIPTRTVRPLKPCLRKPSCYNALRPVLKKSVRFAPDTVEVNRESKAHQLQPNVRIGPQLYMLKLPGINTLGRVTPSTTFHYTARSMSMSAKHKEYQVHRANADLKVIREDDVAITDEDLSVTSTSPYISPSVSPNISPDISSDCATGTSTVSGKGTTSRRGSGTESSICSDTGNGTDSGTDSGTAQPSGTSVRRSPPGCSGVSKPKFTDVMRVRVSPKETTGKYVVSKVQDRWKVTIQNL